MFDSDKCKKIIYEELLLIKSPFFSTFEKRFVNYKATQPMYRMNFSTRQSRGKLEHWD